MWKDLRGGQAFKPVVLNTHLECISVEIVPVEREFTLRVLFKVEEGPVTVAKIQDAVGVVNKFSENAIVSSKDVQ